MALNIQLQFFLLFAGYRCEKQVISQISLIMEAANETKLRLKWLWR